MKSQIIIKKWLSLLLSLSPLLLVFVSSCSDSTKITDKAQTPQPLAKILSVNLAAGDYGLGQTISLDVEFDEVVDVSGEPQLKIIIGGYSKVAAYASGSGEKHLIFNYQVFSDDIDTDGIEATSIDLNSGTIKDKAGNAADLSFTSPVKFPLVKVDGQVPKITNITSMAKTYGTGQSIAFTVAFDETVDVDANSGKPLLKVKIAGQAKDATYDSGSGSKSLVFKYTVNKGEVANGVAATALELNSGAITDKAGNAADLSIAKAYDFPLVKVDGRAPKISDITSTAKTYGSGQSIAFTVVFDETVDVDANSGKPLLKVKIAGQAKDATYDSGSGSKSLVFKYTVNKGEVANGVAATALELNSGAITDKAGNAADLSMAKAYDFPLVKIDGITPVIQSLSAQSGTYTSGEKIKILVKFSNAVTVDTAGSVITIDLNVGGSIVQARYAATTADTMEFIYIASGTMDLDGVEVVADSIKKGGNASIISASDGVDVIEKFEVIFFPNIKVNAPFDLSKITDIWFDSVDIDADGDSTDQSVGYAVKTFYDKSGNDHHISSGAGGEPEVKLNADNNGNLSVYFEATSRNFLGGTKDPNLGTSGYTYFTAFNASHNSAGGSFNYLFGARGDFMGGSDNANGVATYLIARDRFHLNSFSLSGTSNGRVNIVPAVSLTNTPVFVSESHSPGLSRVFSQGGQPDKTLRVGTHLTAGKRVSMGGLNDASYFANGYVNEAFYFNRTLTLAERAIIENYLGAKWSSPHSTLDYYSGDDNSKSDYDHDVTGILKLSPTTIGSQTLPASSVSTARNGALLIANSASDGFLKDEGDSVFAGSKGNGATKGNLPSPASVSTVRSGKVWYLDVSDDSTNSGGKIDLAFTPSLMSLDWTADAASYELLWRAGVSGDFVRVALSSGATNDVVDFRGIDVHTSISDGLMTSTDNIIKSGYITLAMADKTPPSLRYAEVTGGKEITLTFDESIANQISGLSLAANTIIGTNIHAKSTNKIVITTGNSIKSAETLSYSGSVISDIAGNDLKPLSGIVVDMPRASIIRLTSSSIVVAGAGDDAITASSGSDVFDYNFITDGNDTITGFDKVKDKIDLSDVLQYSNGQDIAKFVAVSDDGTNTTINVDAHGRGNTLASTRDISIKLNGVTGSTLDSLINDEVLVVTAP